MQMKLDFFFSAAASDSQPQARREPSFAKRLRPILFDRGNKPQALLALPAPDHGKMMSPRELAEWAHEMYVQGSLSWEEYRCAACHPELSADYNSTVGALTGEPADPDRPRDMVREWEDRLAFLLRHNPSDHKRIHRLEKIIAALRMPMPADGRSVRKYGD